MRNSLNLRYRMCMNVRTVLDTYAPIVASVPKLAERATEFRAQFSVLDGKITIGVAGTEGHTETKNALRDQLALTCFSLANAVWSHAADINNEILKASIPVILSDFQYGREFDLLARFRAVIAAANQYHKEIEAHGITPAQLTKANTDMTAYDQNINLPKSTRSNNAVKLALFIDDFKGMDTVLEKLDRAVNSVMLQQEEFHKAYFKSRYLGSKNLNKQKDAAEPVERKFPQPNPAANQKNMAEVPFLEGGGPYERPRPH